MRSFIALELPESFRLQVAGLARTLSAQVKGRFMPPDNYHLTLAFLGDISERDVMLAMAVLDEAGAKSGVVPVEGSGLGKFGKARDATLWLGLRPNDELMQLAENVRESLAKRQIEFDDKPFKPHITIARRASIPKGVFPELPFPQGDHADTITLFKSELDSSGATYHPLHSVHLGSPQQPE